MGDTVAVNPAVNYSYGSGDIAASAPASAYAAKVKFNTETHACHDNDNVIVSIPGHEKRRSSEEGTDKSFSLYNPVYI